MKVLLAGGGHGHINVLKNLIKNPVDADFTLVTDFKRQYYSGMLPGFIEGIYTEDEISFNVPDLCKRAGVKYVEDKILSIDQEAKKLYSENAAYDYDIISINLGSLSNIIFPIESENVCLVKPISEVVKAKEELDTYFKSQGQSGRLIFIGGGASGVELALAFRAAYKDVDIEIITAHDILENFNDRAKRKLEKILKDKNIFIRKNERVEKIKDQVVFTDKGTYDFTHAFITTGFRGPDVKFDNFQTTDKNYLWVSDSLLAGDDALVMGDTATLRAYPDLNKAGVFAIREAPILYANLIKAIENKTCFESYTPQTKYLQIINCGGKKAAANYGGLAFYGRLMWKLKDKIDRKYMEV